MWIYFFRGRVTHHSVYFMFVFLTGELKLCYLTKIHFITMQTFQMAILLLFENARSLSCSEIVNTLQLNWEQFVKNCSTLIECKILLSNTKVI